MNRTYEVMFIVRPDLEEADIDKLIEGFSTVDHQWWRRSDQTVEKMGRRRLAYTVKKFNDGFYVLLTVAAAGSLVTEIERRLRVSEPVIKFITVRTDEEDKRLAKVKAIRDTKVKRSAQPQASPEANTPASMPPTLAEAKTENLPQTVADGPLSEANLQPEAPAVADAPAETPAESVPAAV